MICAGEKRAMHRSNDLWDNRIEVLRSHCGAESKYPPLLFVHGAWHGAWCWDHGFLNRVARQGFDVHAMSLRGHGKSVGRESLRTTRVKDYVDDIEGVANSLNAPPIIIGHSMGGFLTQKIMERRTFPGAVLLASMPPSGVAAFTGMLIRTDPVGVLQAQLTLQFRSIVSTPDRVKRLFFSEYTPNADIDYFTSQLGDEALLAFFDMLFSDLCRPAKGTPVLVLGAANDAIFSVETTRRIAAAYETEAVIFPDMAHDMMLERGWETVADTIADWVRAGCQQKIPVAA
jgi:pimeloyl-ACP methyl ester carboxylesterase